MNAPGTINNNFSLDTGLTVDDFDEVIKNLFDEKEHTTLQRVWQVFWTVHPTLCCFAIAHITTQQLALNTRYSIWRFLLEYLIICVPVVLSVNICNNFDIFFILIFAIYLWLISYRKKCLPIAQIRTYDLGGRYPRCLTLFRATVNTLTSVCILAIDFKSFPREFRKRRFYGAALMDVGIGMFIFSMGAVSRRPCHAKDLQKFFKTVAFLLFLGLARTIVITYIGYDRDEHEYGTHFNAFFTLGCTKLFGTLLSARTTMDVQLLPIGLGLLILHEITLTFGISEFVMDMDLERKTFLTANREGICSLPGFIALYILSMYIGKYFQTHAALKYNEFMQKLKVLAMTSFTLWILVVISIFTTGIARVTCNFGYTLWMLAIAITMTMLYMFVFDFVLNTIWPVESTPVIEVLGDGEEIMQKPIIQRDTELNTRLLPSLVEGVNRNGLTFFLIANILTGGVNIFLNPDARTAFESVVILCGYMFISTSFVYILHRLNLRIA